MGLELLRPGVWSLRVGIIGRMYLAFSACLALTWAFSKNRRYRTYFNLLLPQNFTLSLSVHCTAGLTGYFATFVLQWPLVFPSLHARVRMGMERQSLKSSPKQG
jgi:hypothetical protein